MLQFLIVVLVVAESVHSAKAMGIGRFARTFPCSEKICPLSANLTGGCTKAPILKDTEEERIPNTNQFTTGHSNYKPFSSTTESSPPKMVFTNDTNEQAPCEEVSKLEGRAINYTDHSPKQKQHMSGLLVTCKANTFRFGSETSTCLNGAWSPPVAVCKVNHALGKPAYQDSTGHDWAADRAVDGNTNTRHNSNSCTHTEGPVNGNRWWYVDLGSSVSVQAIVIYSREGHYHRLLDAKVRIGNHTDDVSMNQLAGTLNDTDINPIHIDVNPAIKGRIVSVSELIGDKILSLCEVQVFGELTD